MTDASLNLPDDTSNTGKKLDESPLTVGGVAVLRQRTVIGDPTSPGGLASIVAGQLKVLTDQGEEIAAQLKRIAALLENGFGQNMPVDDFYV